MVEHNATSILLSVHVLLPEVIDRRLAQRTEKLIGASWPTWGGHITLVPAFVPLGDPREVQAILREVCASQQPFVLRFGEPVAVADVTRLNYSAVLLSIEEVVAESEGGSENGDVSGEQLPAKQLGALRERLLNALASMREDIYPQLVGKPFFPHVTLALGLSESEATKLVRELRAEPITAEFKVEVIWLVTHTTGDTPEFDRDPIALGRFAKGREA